MLTVKYSMLYQCYSRLMTSKLDVLPNEIIYSIFNNVPSRQLWTDLRYLDKRINSFIVSKDYWLKRFKDKHNITVRPEIRQNKELHELLKINVEVEEIKQRFDDNDCLTDYLSCTCHSSTPDALHIRKINNRRILFTGSRDHQIVIWDLENAVKAKSLKEGRKLLYPEAHNGWIWDIKSTDQFNFYSCGWDSKVKMWKLSSSAVMEDFFVTGQAFLKLAPMDNCMCASNYNGKVYVIDFKTQQKLISEIDTKLFNLDGRKCPAIEVYYDDQHNGLIVGSEDGSIYVFDPRNLSEPKATTKISKLKSLNYNSGQLACCSKHKCLLLDPSTLDVELDFTEYTSTNPYRCIPTYGGYFCADDFDIKIFTAGLTPKKITQATFSHRINNLIYGTTSDLIAALGEGSIQCWPREQIFEGRIKPDDL